MFQEKFQKDIAIDSGALQRRLALNRLLGARDFDGWILKQLHPKPGEHILDIGCGIGKFAIPCAQIVGNKGGVTGLDLSEESLAKLRVDSKAQGLEITAICARMEELAQYVPNDVFDAVLSSYALYYSDKPEQTIHEICRCLKQEGRLLVVGPDRKNNQELLDLLEPIIGIPETSIYNQSFAYEIVIPVCKVLFRELRVEHFKNPIIFSDAQLLLEYWRSGGYYRPEAEDAVQKAVASYFSERSKFILHKRIVSVLAVRVVKA